ncbi:MAG: hypothetical protein M1837_000135 [Sclerophora amabilis]|nr:MAG: hypothetical protein M1837_000135 [Sclerophora amabilis]
MSSTISQRTIPIAGILVTIHGLDELLPAQHEIACVWLLHPRLSKREQMEPIAVAAINAWKSYIEAECGEEFQKKGLIAVSFDHRNHGSRLVSPEANGTWRNGNPTHAQDMFSIYEGTSHDLSHLQTHLASYIFQSAAPVNTTPNRILSEQLVLGVSLGGHSAWHSLLHNPMITAGIIIIGCPDYIRLMADRAAKSLKSFTSSLPVGAAFLGSPDFPPSLLDAVNARDPAAILMRPFVPNDDYLGTTAPISTTTSGPPLPKEADLSQVRALMTRHLGNKRILNLAGAADKLVPYAQAAPFMQFLKAATTPWSNNTNPAATEAGEVTTTTTATTFAGEGWFADGGLEVRDVVFDGVGHEMTPAMVAEVEKFIVRILSKQTERSEAETPNEDADAGMQEKKKRPKI